MPSLEKQIRRFNCVVECCPTSAEGGREVLKQEEISDCLKDLSVGLPCKYWAMLHDLDTDEDTGELKRPHIHVVLETNTRHTFLGVVRKISEAFGIAQNRVSVRETRNENSAIRYLMHMDDPEKQPYLPFDVFTNDKEGLNIAILNPQVEMTIEALIDAIARSKNELELARKIGLKNYQRYRQTIHDLVPQIEKEKRRKEVKQNEV